MSRLAAVTGRQGVCLSNAVTNAACGPGPIDVKTMAFVLLVPDDNATHRDGINQVDTFRATWQTYGNGPATGGLGKFDTSLSPVCPPSVGRRPSGRSAAMMRSSTSTVSGSM